MQKEPAVYILANKRNGTIYIGVTIDLIKRVHEHRNKLVDGFSNKYGTDMLVYYESCDSMEAAILREKQIKRWKRDWKMRLINKMNPGWDDLYYQLL